MSFTLPEVVVFTTLFLLAPCLIKPHNPQGKVHLVDINSNTSIAPLFRLSDPNEVFHHGYFCLYTFHPPPLLPSSLSHGYCLSHARRQLILLLKYPLRSVPILPLLEAGRVTYRPAFAASDTEERKFVYKTISLLPIACTLAMSAARFCPIPFINCRPLLYCYCRQCIN